MKVLFIQPDCRPYRIEFFQRLSHEVELLHVAHLGKIITDNTHSDRFQELKLRATKYNGFTFVSSLAELVGAYDVVVCSLDIHWLSSIEAVLRWPEKIVLWGHSLGAKKIPSLIRQWMIGRVEAVVTYGVDAGQEMIDLGISPKKVFTANNTIHVSNFSDQSKQEKKYLLYVGRLQPRKELDLVLTCLERCQNTEEPLELVVLGDGDIEEEKLKKIVAQKKIENLVTFLPGTTDDEELQKCFAHAHAYVSPGHVGLGVLHSFAYGVPVITLKERNHAPEVNNIVHEHNGILSSEEKLCSYLDEIVKGKYPQLGTNAYTTYRDTALIDHMVNGFLKALKKVYLDSNR